MITYNFQDLKQGKCTANICNGKMRTNGLGKNLIENLPHSNLSSNKKRTKNQSFNTTGTQIPEQIYTHTTFTGNKQRLSRQTKQEGARKNMGVKEIRKAANVLVDKGGERARRRAWGERGPACKFGTRTC